MQGANAALVIGPPELGVAAIDFDALYPPARVINAAGVGPASLRQRAEELVTTALLALVVGLLLLPGVVVAQESAARAEATDLVYEAADALDQARAELEAGRKGEGERLLSKAERDLERAAELDPTAPRLGFERARLAQLDGVPEEAAAVLEEYRPSP